MITVIADRPFAPSREMDSTLPMVRDLRGHSRTSEAGS